MAARWQASLTPKAIYRWRGFWGMVLTASSDGQFFPTTRQGEATSMINAKYDHELGLKANTHVSDQFAPFASQTIPA